MSSLASDHMIDYKIPRAVHFFKSLTVVLPSATQDETNTIKINILNIVHNYFYYH